MTQTIGSSEDLIENYRFQLFKKTMLLVVSIACLLLTIGLLSMSAYDNITLWQAYEVIINHILGNEYEFRSELWWADRTIWYSIIPRVLAGILAGMSLAAAGTLMQSLMKNPLADPYSTGISSGACFGAIAAMVTGLTITASQNGTVISAFIGAMIPVAIIIVISKKMDVSPATLILIGTAISYFFNSMVTYMMVITDAETLQNAYIWQIGTLDNVQWESIPLIATITLIGSVIVMFLSKTLNVMSLGDASAKTLGLDVEKVRTFCLLVMAVMTASIVCFTGTIGFVGLVAPHVVRMIIGSDNKFVIPISMTFGALLLVFADYVAFSIVGLPVGLITSMIGSPIFLLLILWQRKGYGAIY